MRHAPDAKVVARLKELTELSDAEITKVANAGQLVNLPAHWGLIWEKTPAHAAYYILEGEVSIQRNHEEIAALGAGEFIGEIAVMNHQLRTASVITKTAVTALNFSAEKAAVLAQEVPSIGEALRATTALRLGANDAG